MLYPDLGVNATSPEAETCECPNLPMGYRFHANDGSVMIMPGDTKPPVYDDPISKILDSVRAYGVIPWPRCAACGKRRGT